MRLFVRVEGVVWERSLAHGGGEGLDQGDHQVDHLNKSLDYDNVNASSVRVDVDLDLDQDVVDLVDVGRWLSRFD